MKRLIAFFILISAICTTVPVSAEDSDTNDKPESFQISGIQISPNDPAWVEFHWQRRHGAPPVSFWEKVAHCETRQNWQNGGRWAGGLGIMTARAFPKQGMGTWERWGGEQFAQTPDKATPLQQIVVANRIAMFGWEAKFRRWDGRAMRVREKHYVKNKVGFNGWGCIKMRRQGSRYGTINPKRFENKTPRPRITYQIFELQVPLNIPNYAWDKVPHKYLK